MSEFPRKALLILAALATTSLVQAQTGGIRVRVVDPAGNALTGALVTLTSAQQLAARSTVAAGPQGVAEFPVLRAGPGYAIEVAFPGYATWSSGELRIPSGEVLEIGARLKTGLVEEVTVRAERPVVDLQTTADTTKFSDQFLDELPVQSRFYQSVLTLAPGVVDPDADGNPNIHGARSRDVKVLLGGVSNVDPLTGQWMSYVNSDSIEELEVITSGAGAEWGRAQGGWGRILQKQGTNEFETLLAFLYRTSDLDGAGATGLTGRRAPEFASTQPSVQLSGPIIKDRLWFRLSHERIRREDPLNVGVGGIQLTTLRQAIDSDQITWQASPRNKVSLHRDADPRTIVNAGITSSIPPESGQTWEFGGPTYRLAWTAAQSPKLLFGSEVGFQDNAVNILPSAPGVPNACLLNRSYPSLDGAQCLYTNFNHYSGSYYRTSRDKRQRLTARSDGEWFAGRFAGGTHHLKFGFAIENERYARNLEVKPDVIFEVYHGLGPPIGFATYRLAIPPRSTAEVSGVQWGLYVEDQFRPAENLTLTAGLRFDHDESNSFGWTQFDPQAEYAAYQRLLAAHIQPILAVREPFTAYQDVNAFQAALAESLGTVSSANLLNAITQQSAFWQKRRTRVPLHLQNLNLAPRLSVAWDPRADGKTKLALSAGRYYDKIFLAVPLIEQEPATTLLTFIAFSNLGYHRVFTTREVPSQKATISQRTVDPGLKTPYQDELALSFERSLSPETLLRVMFIRRAFKDQVQDEDVNHRTGDYGRCLRDRYGRTTLDTSRGPDGVLDDCMFGGDGVPDLYTMNPGWEQILRVDNLNTTQYRAAVLELTRRMYQGWELHASYTLSRAEGDGEDFDQVLGNDRTRIQDERGVLAYDQTHVVKVSAAGILPHGVHLGGIVRWESGLPFSTYASWATAWGVPPDSLGGSSFHESLILPSGRRNDRRDPAFWTIDLRVGQEWKLGRRANLQLSAEVFNLLNDDAIHYVDITDAVPNTIRRFGRRWQLGTRFAF